MSPSTPPGSKKHEQQHDPEHAARKQEGGAAGYSNNDKDGVKCTSGDGGVRNGDASTNAKKLAPSQTAGNNHGAAESTTKDKIICTRNQHSGEKNGTRNPLDERTHPVENDSRPVNSQDSNSNTTAGADCQGDSEGVGAPMKKRYSLPEGSSLSPGNGAFGIVIVHSESAGEGKEEDIHRAVTDKEGGRDEEKEPLTAARDAEVIIKNATPCTDGYKSSASSPRAAGDYPADTDEARVGSQKEQEEHRWEKNKPINEQQSGKREGSSSTLKEPNSKKRCICLGSENKHEIEKFLGSRKHADGKTLEFHVQWKASCGAEDMWIPYDNLPEKAKKEALRFHNSAKAANLKQNRGNNVQHDPCAVDDIDWSDSGQLIFREIARIEATDQDAARRVREARENGVPVCIRGHHEWAQFAHRWLKPVTSATANATAENKTTKQQKLVLDLNQSHEVDVEKIKEDIGEEVVPVLEKNYDASNPFKKDSFLKASEFIQKHWPSPVQKTSQNESEGQTDFAQQKAYGYLHQWQFPLSETARPKLCSEGAHVPMPNDILGEDMLQYWQDYFANPYQYIFMGREDTVSRMHRDDGGLLITIAPLVGLKEVTLVHRADGASCLAHLEAKIDSIDLHQHPLAAFTRVWKSVIRPGEILIMPQGTYHQCRNLTPCLSYSRFHLDQWNLLPYLESLRAGDVPAPVAGGKASPEDAIWHAAIEFRERLKTFSRVERAKLETLDAAELASTCAPAPHSILTIVKTLKKLRNVCRDIALNGVYADDVEERKVWHGMVFDIDKALHDFRFRGQFPKPFHRAEKDTYANIQEPSSHSTAQVATKKRKCKSKDIETSIAEDSRSFIDGMLKKARKLRPQEIGLAISDSTATPPGTRIAVRLQNRVLQGEILCINEYAQMALLHYKGLSHSHDAYQRFHSLRKPVSGENSVEASFEDIAPGKIVHEYTRGEEYPARVLSVRTGTFYRVQLYLAKKGNSFERWLPRDSFIEVISGPVNGVIEDSLEIVPSSSGTLFHGLDDVEGRILQH